MHNLKPNTEYKIVCVELAFPATWDESTIADCINETLRPVVHCGELADYAFNASDEAVVIEQTPRRKPEEGQLWLCGNHYRGFFQPSPDHAQSLS